MMTSRLSSDQLTQLTPLLGSLARLIARGAAVSSEQLKVLLTAADLEDNPDALQELQRWARLLQSVYDSPNEALRHTVVEGLMLRGLPEAPVLLAIATVAEQARATPSAASWLQTGRLTVSVSRLDLGTLRPGQVASREFEVQGNSGRIVVESDQLVVTPQQFGPGPTQIQVEVKPLTGGILWTSLKLITAGETVEVPVLAQWEESLPSAAPIPRDALVVAPDGSGTHRTLTEALTDAEPGATILLRRGTHELEQGLLLHQPVTLVGEGMDATELVADQGDYVLRYEGSGLFGLHDLAVHWTGTGLADVVTVHSGEVQIERCCFSGATFSDKTFGGGLELKGNVRGRVMGCLMRVNGYGIIVGEQAQPDLEGNTCQDNKASGIRYSGASAGIAHQNTCTSNEQYGISVGGQAQPVLETNTCQGNEWGGIVASEQAQPYVEGNACQGNKDSGIAYFGTAAGTARHNTCTDNEKFGIYVGEQAQPTLEANTCQGNKQSGIAYFGSTAGTARDNTCTSNEQHGIYVGEQAQPMLDGNTCRSNNVDGISVRNEAAPRILANICQDNGEDGIYVASTARPTLRDNRCRGNKGRDVNDQRSSSTQISEGKETVIELPQDIYDSMVAHAREDFPNMACGLLAGTDWKATHPYRCRNVAGTPTTQFQVGPQDQLNAFRDFEEKGLDLIGIYYSDKVSAYPSQTTIRLWFYPDKLCFIVSLVDRDGPVVRAFWISDEGQVTEQPISTRTDSL